MKREKREKEKERSVMIEAWAFRDVSLAFWLGLCVNFGDRRGSEQTCQLLKSQMRDRTHAN